MKIHGQSFLKYLSGQAAAVTFATLVLACGPAHAFPSLNLSPRTPDIFSNFINVSYDAGTGVVSASGFAQTLTPPGSSAGNISTIAPNFNISATIDDARQTAVGSLTIGGTIAGLGYDSGTLLTGTFSSTVANQKLGAGASGAPLEFLFAVTGGDAAGPFGQTAGVILANSGYSGSFASNFMNAASGTVFDTFGVLPEPATLALFLVGGGMIALGRRRKHRRLHGL